MDVQVVNPTKVDKKAGPATFFETLYQTFHRAQSADKSERWFFRIAGKTICLQFAGTALVPALTPALAHLSRDPVADPDLRICLWDESSTGIPVPRPPWSGRVYGPRGEIHKYNDDQFQTVYSFGSRTLSMFDSARNLGIFCARDASLLPTYEKGSPLRTILHWGLRGHGLQLVHGGAVGRPSGGVLLAGKGGSGKSTTALRCLASELLYVSDDYCVLEPGERPYVHSLYSTAKVAADNIARVASLKPAISNIDRLDTQKAVMFLQRHYPEKIISGFAIRAVLLPRITGRSSTGLTAATPTEALSSLALSTVRQLPGADNVTVEMIERVTGQVPCWYLELGTDLSRIPAVILDVIAGCGTA